MNQIFFIFELLSSLAGLTLTLLKLDVVSLKQCKLKSAGFIESHLSILHINNANFCNPAS